jgi:hypothetical protein
LTYEELLNEVYDNGIIVDEDYFFQSNLKGLYIDKHIALADSLDTSSEKACILAEELGHYYTSSGNILDQRNVANRKQELRARRYAFRQMIPLNSIVDAYRSGCCNCYEIANFLGVTEDFLSAALIDYQSQYGFCVTSGDFIIYFDPLRILEIL